MNIQEYISSGIVESYVLGMADAAERAEFERMCEMHPEVLAARNAFALKLEDQLMETKLQPPVELKNRIFSAIAKEKNSAGASVGGGFGTPPADGQGFSNDSDPARPEMSKMKVRRIGFDRMLAAASVFLLVLSTILNFYFFKRYTESNTRYEALLASQSDLAQHNNLLQTRLLEYEKAVDMMKNPDMAIVKLQAVPTAPNPSSATTLYWDTNTKDVYLTVNVLPEPPKDQQYQLWAIVDGKPVDAGVFDIHQGPGMVKMKNIVRAEAFAITLEKKGGSPTPTMEKMYVMGRV